MPEAIRTAAAEIYNAAISTGRYRSERFDIITRPGTTIIEIRVWCRGIHDWLFVEATDDRDRLMAAIERGLFLWRKN